MEKVLFVGAGSMAEAIISGIVKQRVLQGNQVYVMNRSDAERLCTLEDRYGIEKVCEDRSVIKEMDLIVLATKPKDIHQAMADIKPLLREDAAILSVIAGTSISAMEEGLGKRPIARSMPNTSATIGKSASGVAWNEEVDEPLKQSILDLLGSIGLVKEVEEDDLHAVTALSGSGPAYIYYLAEAMEAAALQQGLTEDVAKELIIQTIEGAAAMLKQTNEQPAVLRKNVTSPGGTTEAGINALESRDFQQTVAEAIDQAAKRSRELGTLTNSIS